MLDEAGVDYGVILAELAPITSAIASNETVDRLCGGHPRLIPFATVNPFLIANPAQELERLVTQRGFRGLKLYPTYNYFYPNDPMLYPVYAKAQELGVPVKWHTGTSAFPASRLKYGDPMHIDDVAVDFPDLVAIITHSGRPLWYEHRLHAGPLRTNVYMEIAGLPPKRLLNTSRPRARERQGLFGSDGPSVPNDECTSRRCARSAVAAGQRAKSRRHRRAPAEAVLIRPSLRGALIRRGLFQQPQYRSGVPDPSRDR